MVVAPVVVVGVDGVAAQVLAGGWVDDVDGVVVDEHQDRRVGVVDSDAEVVEFPGSAQGEFAEPVDDVDADTLPKPAVAPAARCIKKRQAAKEFVDSLSSSTRNQTARPQSGLRLADGVT